MHAAGWNRVPVPRPTSVGGAGSCGRRGATRLTGSRAERADCTPPGAHDALLLQPVAAALATTPATTHGPAVRNSAATHTPKVCTEWPSRRETRAGAR